jgi:hypothetical protein
MLNFMGRTLAVTAAALVMTGCGAVGALGGLGDVLGTVIGQPSGGGQGQGQLEVEIQSVDTRQQLIQVATQDGRSGGVRYDANTAVWYRGQQFPVTALERGDVGVMQLVEVQGGLYAQRVDVQQSVRDRTGQTGATGTVSQVAGRITRIDHSGGTFELEAQGGRLIVTLPYNPPQATLDYFQRLRAGNTVRLEVVPLTAGRAEVYRFL